MKLCSFRLHAKENVFLSSFENLDWMYLHILIVTFVDAYQDVHLQYLTTIHHSFFISVVVFSLLITYVSLHITVLFIQVKSSRLVQLVSVPWEVTLKKEPTVSIDLLPSLDECHWYPHPWRLLTVETSGFGDFRTRLHIPQSNPGTTRISTLPVLLKLLRYLFVPRMYNVELSENVCVLWQQRPI